LKGLHSFTAKDAKDAKESFTAKVAKDAKVSIQKSETACSSVFEKYSLASFVSFAVRL
jgi:hypothetical protein